MHDLPDSQPPTVALLDPRTGQARGERTAGRASAVAAAVAKARQAQPGWDGLVAAERSRRLLRLAAVVEDLGAQYVRAERAGTGKPEHEAVSEVAAAIDVLRFYAGAVRAQTGPAAGHRLAGRESWVRWEPLGVVAAIVPWNYPLLMLAWRLGPAIAAGNTVVAKPAETTPDSAELLAEHAAAELGGGVLQVLPGDRETGRLLVASAVDAVAFTGSESGGRDVLARAGLRPVSLELGGNCPVVVLPDAPTWTYAELAAACTYNAGQSCAAPARVVTLRENYDDVVAGLATAVTDRPAGESFGPLNNPDQLARYDRLVGTAAGERSHGLVVTSETESGGFWRPATVLADLPEDAPAVVEEVFAPVLTVQAAVDLEDALRLANAVGQALAGSVWSRSGDRAIGLARRLDAGEVWVNCHLEQTAELPHGGRRLSGHGTDLSVVALAEYQRPKTVTVRAD